MSIRAVRSPNNVYNLERGTCDHAGTCVDSEELFYIVAVGMIAVKPPTCMTPCKSTTMRELVGGLFSFLFGLTASRSLRSVDP